MIRVQCGGCGAQFSAGDNQAGKSGKCPKCGGPIQVPAASVSTAISPAANPLPVNPQLQPVASAVSPAALPSSGSPTDDDKKPTVIEQTAKKFKAAYVVGVLVLLAGMALLFGVTALVFNGMNYGSTQKNLQWAGVILIGVGTLECVIVRALAWWYHG